MRWWRRRIHQCYRFKVNEKRSNQAFRKLWSGHDINVYETTVRGYEWVLGIYRDTDVLLLLVHFMPVVEVWMIPGTAKKRKCYPVHTVSQPTTSLAKLQLFGKGKKGLDMLPPTRYVLELHAICVNYQANIWWKANKEIIDVSPLVATTA